jgi:hypothetical protein
LSRRDADRERRVAELLARLGRRVPAPPEDELRRMARTAATERRLPQPPMRRPLWRPLRLRWGLVVAAALLLGSGFGFGLGTWRTPSGSAGTSFAGLGFLPAKGWTVVQSGTVGPTGTAHAVAANVALAADDGPARLPYDTLASLPAEGVLIFTTFSTRGDPPVDGGFSPRELPLRIADARPAPESAERLATAVPAERRLRVAVDAYNVDVRIFFGSAPPSAGMLRAAQRQLNRLVVASEQVTLAARTTIVGRQQPAVTLFGRVASPNAGEPVTIQGKECGVPGAFFRAVGGTHTVAGGGWTVEQFVRTTTVLRAVWREATSSTVTIRTRVSVALFERGRNRFDVTAHAAVANLQRKRVLIQRLDRRVGTWRTVKSLTLSSEGFAGFGDRRGVRLDVPDGTTLRAVMPRSQTGPCYLAGFSNVLRT